MLKILPICKKYVHNLKYFLILQKYGVGYFVWTLDTFAFACVYCLILKVPIIYGLILSIALQ